jgi:hypothetical protein
MHVAARSCDVCTMFPVYAGRLDHSVERVNDSRTALFECDNGILVAL